MADVFISYSTADERLARFVHDHLATSGVSVFLASISIQPGQQWTEHVHNALRGASWVIFLASRPACSSPFVQQELGGAILMQKKLVPIVWDMTPSELPGWAPRHQAIDLAGATVDVLQARLSAIAERIKADKRTGLLLLGLIVAGLIVSAGN